MEKNDYYKIGVLMLIPVLIFIPLFYSHYFYTDEVFQLWLYRNDPEFAMFVPQGRMLTDMLMRIMYNSIELINQLHWLRLFSLACWLICIPIWYSVLRSVCKNESLPRSSPFFIMLFLVCSLPFNISIQWAACMELSIAYTCGLLSGYCVYQYNQRGWLPAVLLGLISLFFYQNCFGCFLLPFFLKLLAHRKTDKKIVTALVIYLAIYGIYFVLFKEILKFVYHIAPMHRTAFLTEPFKKIYYLFSKILPQAFYFNVVLNDESIIGRIWYLLLGAFCLVLNYRKQPMKDYLFFIFQIFAAMVLAYLPSMVIKEDYSSNRTLLAVDLIVFCWVFHTMTEGRNYLQPGVAVALVVLAWYNFRVVFLPPAIHEYEVMKSYINENYHPGISSIDFIRPDDMVVRKKYGIQSSWDEYGMSSSFFGWVPETETRQLIFEKTGDKVLAQKIGFRLFKDKHAFGRAGDSTSTNTLLIDAQSILQK